MTESPLARDAVGSAAERRTLSPDGSVSTVEAGRDRTDRSALWGVTPALRLRDRGPPSRLPLLLPPL